MPDPLADARLAAAGDRRAFERLYNSNVGRIHSLCLRMVTDRSRAEELTQDVFVRAWQRLNQFRGESAFSTWLHRLAVNVVLNQIKTSKRENQVMDGSADTVAMPGRAAMVAEQIDLEEAIASLPAGARQIFVLHDVEGFKHAEIGEMLGITSGGSKAQLHRARMMLRERLLR